jgi:hypothetical protein
MTLGALPFLLLVVVALPGLAAATGRRLREVEPGDVSPRAVYLQTVLTQAVIAVLGLLALRATSWGTSRRPVLRRRPCS